MKTIIAGSRSITDYGLLLKAIELADFEVTSVVSGTAKGVDSLGEKYSKEQGLECYRYPAKWKDLDVPGARIKTNAYGQYNANAGHQRNELMADNAEALILVWDGNSPGSRSMLRLAKSKGLKVFSYIVKK